jgi:hypothetical protein
MIYYMVQETITLKMFLMNGKKSGSSFSTKKNSISGAVIK